MRALRAAVAEGRVGHAYLFSGPRGTGKTSTARILAKVLNCANPADGEPCGVCEACVAVDQGRMVDWLQEHDAASNRGIDRMRSILETIPLGTSRNRKVIILDEVHMLTKEASNTLLKSLEEPPEHVVFVLATTDPQQVLPTIRSRTQHFIFELLPMDELADHVRWVIEDAGLGLGEDAVQHVLRVGGGSARDTLSALDQVAAMGGVFAGDEPVDAILAALADRDAGAVLVAVADAVHVGRDIRGLGSALVARLRDAFLVKMGAGDRHLPEGEQERAAELAERLGAAGLTRALEVIGEALTDITKKPDTRVALEVALVRLCRPEVDRDVAALAERIDRLERASSGGTAAAAAATRAVAPTGGVPAGPVVAPTKRAAPRRAGPTPPAAPTAETSSPSTPGPLPSPSELEAAWEGGVLEALPGLTRSLFRMGRFVESSTRAATFALPNDPHRAHCEKKRTEVEAALAAHFGRPVPLELVVDSDTVDRTTSQAAAPPDDDVGDVSALDDAPGAMSGVDRITQAFPGAELVDDA